MINMIFQDSFYKEGFGYIWPIPLVGLLLLPNVSVTILNSLDDLNLANTSAFLFKAPATISTVAHGVVLKKFFQKWYFMDSALPRRPKSIAQPGEQNPKPCDQIPPTNATWPQWGLEPVTEEKLRQIITSILESPQLVADDDSKVVFSVCNLPAKEELDKLDGQQLANSFKDRPDVYKKIGTLMGWKLRKWFFSFNRIFFVVLVDMKNEIMMCTKNFLYGKFQYRK